MTTHLRDDELVDFAEGTLDHARAAHVEVCDECRTKAEGVGTALREVSAVEMPEPSPLFWDHFSARVRHEVAHETPARAAWWTRADVRALMPLVAVLAIMVAIGTAALLPRVRRPVSTGGELASSHAAAETSVAAVDVELPAPVDAKDAEVWDVLTAAASDMGVDEAHSAGITARPGAVDHAVTHLSQAELTELGRLLQSQLKGSGH
jgi:hypothetical protein